MRDEAAASERRRQLANSTLIVGGFSAVRGLMEAIYVFATRGVGWRTALLLTLPSWLMLAPLAAGTIVLARRFPFERRNWMRSAFVHVVASVAFGLIHVVGITPFRVLLAAEPLTWERLVPAFFLAFRLLFYLDVLTYWAIVGMSLALHYSNLRTSLAEARLAALRAQLIPTSCSMR